MDLFNAGNTITNVSMIIPPLVGAVTSWRSGLERRYTASYILLTGEELTRELMALLSANSRIRNSGHYSFKVSFYIYI